MKQFGFLFDPAICVGCRSCQFACREANHLAPQAYFRRVLTIEPEEKAGYAGFFSVGCNHCQDPACVKACQNGAMYRDPTQGVVLHDSLCCIGCGACVWACPYGAVSIDAETGKSHKCTSCLPRREQGLPPACAAACPTKALRFGPLEEMEEAGGEMPAGGFLPDPGITQPSLRILTYKRKEEFLCPYSMQMW